MTRRLADRVILVTRAAEDAEAWIEAIRSRGARAVSLPCIATELLAGADVRAALEAGLETASWVVFTSRRGVAATAELLGEPIPAGVRVAAVGPSTAEEAEARRPDLEGLLEVIS
jgi:uroporphyrinogen-III synthase